MSPTLTRLGITDPAALVRKAIAAGQIYPAVTETPAQLRRRAYNRARTRRVRSEWAAQGLNSRGKTKQA